MNWKENVARIFLIDNHPSVRQGLKQLLAQESHVVCGEAGSGGEAFESIGASGADLAFLDLSLGRESGLDLMTQLLALTPLPDGVFCYNDPMAIGAIHAILDAGLRVPDDIAVIGSGNLHYDAELRVPLSSIDQQTEKIGEHAARLTLSLIEAKTPPRAMTVILQPRLVIRASTCRKQAQ